MFFSVSNNKTFATSVADNAELESELEDNISNILDDIESNELDDFLPVDFLLPDFLVVA